MNTIERATAWRNHDPDPHTRDTITALIDAAETGDQGAYEELESRFSGPLMFGTAGLRGEVGAGESRMNRAVVIRATAGVVSWLNTKVDTPVVVIGCDARYGSADFYRDAAEVISGASGRALLLPPQLPTPVTAFAVRAFGADAGIMITASHNPPADNGYKLYLGGRVAPGDGNGVQLVSPADAEITEHITAAPPADQVPRTSTNVEHVDILDQYIHCAGTRGDARPLNIVLTPMHGVGGSVAVQALAAAGFHTVDVVKQQADPDPDFPTVSFPNPEEPGALDLAIELAKERNADVILALDPDADRCAVAIPTPTGWRQLSGDETGALLGEYIAKRTQVAGNTGTMANSIVSSRLLSRIAHAHDLNHEPTLTGFKWIARTPGLIFGYEEAIGYCTDPEFVRDKDGITAAVTMASLVANLLAQGRTVQDALDDLAKQHGLHATSPLTFRVENLDLIATGMANLRAHPPRELAGSPVIEFADLAEGYQGLPATDGVLLRTEQDDRIIVRPSGTEPKLKCYLEVVLPVVKEIPHDDAAERLAMLKNDIAAAIGI
ncbi:phospho-sugar mutase [Corynebacterium freiburgense]|uniref:phospho-sugar mutase n=1 Tax=Corynebacterium freiburgense TaxID=556548 RepID=UPI00040EA57B|nr:phospho-sugar mutase [Corynebacterium freiburgense]WJZ03342.1 putative phosphomannomutase [Corynebacterium freiburgense]